MLPWPEAVRQMGRLAAFVSAAQQTSLLKDTMVDDIAASHRCLDSGQPPWRSRVPRALWVPFAGSGPTVFAPV